MNMVCLARDTFRCGKTHFVIGELNVAAKSPSILTE